jgi:hypothetical protein
MKKEIKTVSVVCDCCESTLVEKSTFLNDGSYQQSYVKYGDIDLCFTCTGKIFDINLKSKIPEEKLSQWVKDFRSKYNKFADLTLFSQTRTNEEDIIKDVPLVVNGLAITNNEHNGLEVPLKNTSDLDQVTSLEDL